MSLQRNGKSPTLDKAFDLALHNSCSELLDKEVTDELLNNTMLEELEVQEMSSDSYSPDVDELYENLKLQYFAQQLATKKRCRKKPKRQKPINFESSKILQLKSKNFPKANCELDLTNGKTNYILGNPDLIDVYRALDDTNSKEIEALDKHLQTESLEAVQPVNDVKETDAIEITSNDGDFFNVTSSEEFDFVVVDAIDASDSNEDDMVEHSHGQLLSDQYPSISTTASENGNAIVNKNNIISVTAIDNSKLPVPAAMSESEEKCGQKETMKGLTIAASSNLVEDIAKVVSHVQLINEGDDNIYKEEILTYANYEDNKKYDEEVNATNIIQKMNDDDDNSSVPLGIKIICDDRTNDETSPDMCKLKMDQHLEPRVLNILYPLSHGDNDNTDHKIQDNINTSNEVASIEIPISLAQDLMYQFANEDDDDRININKSITNNIEEKACEAENKNLILSNKLETNELEVAEDSNIINGPKLFCLQDAKGLETSKTIIRGKKKKNVTFGSPINTNFEELSSQTEDLQKTNICGDVNIGIANNSELTLKSDDAIDVETKSFSVEILNDEVTKAGDKDQNHISSESCHISLELDREIMSCESQSLQLSISSLMSSSSTQENDELDYKRSKLPLEEKLPDREVENTNNKLAENPIIDVMDLSLPKLIRTDVANNDSIPFSKEQSLKELTVNLETRISPKVVDDCETNVNDGISKGRHKFVFKEKVIKTPLSKIYDKSLSNVDSVNTTCASIPKLPNHPLAPLALLTKGITKSADKSLSSVPEPNNKSIKPIGLPLLPSSQNNKLPADPKSGENSIDKSTSLARRLVKFKDDFDPVESFFNLRQKASNHASSLTLTSSESRPHVPVHVLRSTSSDVPMQEMSAMCSLPKATDLGNLPLNSGTAFDPSIQCNRANSCALPSSLGNVAIVTPSFNLKGPNVTDQTSFPPSQSEELPKQRGPFTIASNVFKIPIIDEYAKLIIALGNESKSSLCLLKSHKVLKDQNVGDLTPEETRFIAREFDNFARNDTKDIGELLKASAILHLIVSVFQSLINCCLPSAANQLKVMTERNRAIIGDSLDDAVSCLIEISDRYKKADVIHPKVLKLIEVLKNNFRDPAMHSHGKDGLKKAIIIIETDYATSLGAYLYECITANVKGIEVASFVPSVQDGDLHNAAEGLKERLSTQTVLISTHAIIPIIQSLVKASVMHLVVIEYSYSNNLSFNIGPNEVLESKVECLALQCQFLEQEQPVGKDSLLEDECLSLRDVLLEQNSYTLITTQDFIKLPDILCSLESKHKITLVERSYSKMTSNVSYCDMLIDHESGFLVNDIFSLTDAESIDEVLVRVARLSLNLSRCWVVFYNFDSSKLTSKLVSNYYTLVSIGTAVSSKLSGYEIKFLCCKSVECMPKIIRKLADHIYKKSLITFKGTLHEKWLNKNYITPDPTKQEMILIAFPCFNSMSAQLLLESKSLKSLMLSSLADLQNVYPMISSKFLKMFIKFRQSTSLMYRQVKENSYFDDGHLEPDSTYFPRHSVHKAVDELNNVTTDSVGDTNFLILNDEDNIKTDIGKDMFSVKMKGNRDSVDIFEGSTSFETNTSDGFYFSPATSGGRWKNGGNWGGRSRDLTSASTQEHFFHKQDHFDYHGDISMDKDYFNNKQYYFKHQKHREGTGHNTFCCSISDQNVDETYFRGDDEDVQTFYFDLQTQSKHNFGWLNQTMGKEGRQYCQRRDPEDQMGMEGFHGYESSSQSCSLYDDGRRCDKLSSSNDRWGISYNTFKPCQSSNYQTRANLSPYAGWRESSDIESSIGSASKKKRKLTYELDDSQRAGQSKLKFI